jgi:hypothetical protein
MFHPYFEKVYLKNKQSVKGFEEGKEAEAVFFRPKHEKYCLLGMRKPKASTSMCLS